MTSANFIFKSNNMKVSIVTISAIAILAMSSFYLLDVKL